MKTRTCVCILRRAMGGLALTATSAVFVGCATPHGYQAAGKSSDVAAEVSTQVAETRDAVARAAVALDGIGQPGDAKPVTLLDEFATAVRSADEAWTRARESHAELIRSTDGYFRQWARESSVIKDESLRETANERRREMEEAIARLREQFSETTDRFTPYLTRLKNLRTILQNDFTDAGVAAADGAIDETRRGSERAREALNELAELAEDVASRFATTTG